MTTDFRSAIRALHEAGELRTVERPVDIRHIGALIEKSKQALLFEHVAGYDMPVVGGVLGSRRRCQIVFGGDASEVSARIDYGASHPITHTMTDTGPAREVTYQVGEQVDLYSLPIPLLAAKDGGPMITAGVIVAKDEGGSLNAGVYRLMLKARNLTGIDIVTANDLRRIVEKNTRANRTTPISVNIGTHPMVLMAASLMPPAGVDEIKIAGGILNEPINLARCHTIDVPCIGDSEIVLEAEVLPTGWMHPEGRFGEFHRSMGALHWNPLVRVNAVYTRRNPLYYALHMPWECVHMGPFLVEGELRRKLREARIDVKAINITAGGSGFFHAVISINARPGEGKTAMMVVLADEYKHVVVVDEDIDVFDPLEVEWAIATRVQADKDVMIVSGLRSKPLDPSLDVVKGVMPTTAKMGIDATIPSHLPRQRFERIRYLCEDEVNLESCLSGQEQAPAPQTTDIDALAEEIKGWLKSGEPMYYSEILKRKWMCGLHAVGLALSALHEKNLLWQDELGRLCLRDSPYAAVPPPSKFTTRA